MNKIIFFFILLFQTSLFADNKICINSLSLKSFVMKMYESEEKISKIGKVDKWQIVSNKFTLLPNKTKWIRLDVKNQTNKKLTKIILFTEANAEYINLYKIEQKRISQIHSGTNVAIRERLIKSPHAAFKIELLPNEQSNYYLEIRSLIPTFEEIWILNAYDFIEYSTKYNFFFLIYFTILSLTLFYSLIFLFFMKEPIFLVYSSYLFFSGIWIFLNSGLYLHYFSSYISCKLSFSVAISYVFLLEFAKKIIRIKAYSTLLYKSLLIAQYTLLLSSVLIIIDISTGITFLMYSGFLTILFLFILTIYILLFSYNKMIKLYFIVLLPLLVSLLIYIMAVINIIEPSYQYQYYYVLGTFFEYIGIAVLSIYYINTVKKSKEIAQNKLYEIQKNYLSDLKKELAEKTRTLLEAKIELENNLEFKSHLIQEIHHRVKNNLQIVISILSFDLLKDTKSYTTKSIKNTISKVQSIAELHSMLSFSPNTLSINIKNYLATLINRIEKIYDNNFDINFICRNYVINGRDSVYLGIIISEIISNSIKHNSLQRKLKIKIFFRITQNRFCLIIHDDGIVTEILATNNDEHLGYKLIETMSKNFLDSKITLSTKLGFRFSLCGILSIQPKRYM